MRRVAFDCAGTLLGGQEQKVLALYKWFESKKCDMYIWSSSYSYTEEAKSKHSLLGTCMRKFDKIDMRNYDMEPMWVAVDDDHTATYLGATHMILVKDIPEDSSLFESKFGHLI